MTGAVTLRLRDRAFVLLERCDEALHARGRTLVPLCRLVGRMEPGYYERTTDWSNPLYVNPERQPDLYLLHADKLCAHGHRVVPDERGYRSECPKGCSA